MELEPSREPDDQLALPFPAEFSSPAGARPDDVTTWPGWLVLEECHQVVRLPVAMLRAVLAGLVRWALRLALPVVCASALLHVFPYHAKVEGVPFRVEGTVYSRPGLSADTTLGNWEFPALDGLPVGVHVTPENVDLLQLTRAANADTAIYVARLRDGFTEQLPRIGLWLLGETLLGVGLGLALAAALNMAVRYLRGLPRRPDEIAHRLRQLGAAAVVTVLVAGYGIASYDGGWVRRSRLTGTLAAMQLFPSQLQRYYQQQSKAYDVLGAVVGIQAALQAQIEQGKTPDTAFRIMYISDLHLAAVYPLVQQYAQNYDVKLIINTGDESEFGTRAELTPTYLAAISAITRKTPMLWLAGNHDSPDTSAAMRAIPGVTVLGAKAAKDDGYSVSASSVNAFGLRVAGLPDPRVYGGPGAYGSDTTSVVDPLERSAVDAALDELDQSTTFDIFATHEPVAAQRLRKDLADRIRQTVSGHVHAQNGTADIQHGSAIDLVEGSTGAGGLDNLVRGADRPPIEFSIESVAPDCQFTRVLRFQIRSPHTTRPATPQAYGDDVTVSTVYFTPQQVEVGRVCSTSQGISTSAPLAG